MLPERLPVAVAAGEWAEYTRVEGRNCKSEDLERTEGWNLTIQCRDIRSMLVDVIKHGQSGAETEASEHTTDEEVRA